MGPVAIPYRPLGNGRYREIPQGVVVGGAQVMKVEMTVTTPRYLARSLLKIHATNRQTVTSGEPEAHHGGAGRAQ